MTKRCDGDREHGDLRKWVLLCCAVVVALPLAIYALYSFGESCPLIVAPWSAGDMLSYCGTLVAAVVAILGVYWSLRSSRREQERQIRDEVAPFFSAVFLTQKNKRDPFIEMFLGRSGQRADVDGDDKTESDQGVNCGDEGYREVDSREIYVILDGDISYKAKLDEEQAKRTQSKNLKVEMAMGVVAITPNPVIFNPIYLKNVGKGAAVSVRVGVNPKESDWAGVQYWTLMPGDYFYLGLYVDTSKQAVFGEYELRVVYFDCLGCQYIQRFELNVVPGDDEDAAPQVQMAYYGSRGLLSDEERERYLSNLGSFL